MEKTKVKNQSQKNEIPTKGNKSIINSNLTVMKNLFKSVMALFIGAAMFSCQQAEEPTMDQGQAPETRAFGDTPVVAIYVETNDTNPLNAGDYTMSNGMKLAVKALLEYDGPAYLRLGRAAVETVTDEIEGYRFELDKGVTQLQHSRRIRLAACFLCAGVMR